MPPYLNPRQPMACKSMAFPAQHFVICLRLPPVRRGDMSFGQIRLYSLVLTLQTKNSMIYGYRNDELGLTGRRLFRHALECVSRNIHIKLKFYLLSCLIIPSLSGDFMQTDS